MTRQYVITGTSRGLGLEMARQLLAAGHRVFALARDPERSKGLAELKERHPDSLIVCAVDVTSDEQVLGFIEKLGSAAVIDVLINNAGIYGGHGELATLSLEDIAQTFATNALAPMRMTRALLPRLQKSRAPKVIHITSLMGSIADNQSGDSYGYRMSKAALNMFHKTLSVDFPKLVSLAVHPGWVKTDMGGADAPTSIPDSVRGIIAVIDKAESKDSGKFFDFEGNELPW